MHMLSTIIVGMDYLLSLSDAESVQGVGWFSGILEQARPK